MNVHEVQCPYCHEWQSLEVEEDVVGRFVQDCYVCCHPWQVEVKGDSVRIERAQ